MATDATQRRQAAPYNSPLRTRQKEQTSELIMQAVGHLLAEGDLSAVTIADVARAAEVTERTIYRHFATREDLLRAFWAWQLAEYGGDQVFTPRSIADLLDNIQRLFASLDTNEGLIRAVVSSPEGREVRIEANRQRLAHMLEFVTTLMPTLPADERHRIAAGIVSVSSVLSWLFMRDNCGYDGRQAGQAASLAVQLMLEAGQLRAASYAPP